MTKKSKGLLAGLLAVIMLMGMMITSVAAETYVYDPDKQVKIYIYVGDEQKYVSASYTSKDFSNNFTIFNDGALYALKDLNGRSINEFLSGSFSRVPLEWSMEGVTVDETAGTCKLNKSITTTNVFSENMLKYVGESNALLLMPKYDFVSYANAGTTRLYTDTHYTLHRTITQSGVEPTYQWYKYNCEASDYFKANGAPDSGNTTVGDGWACIISKTAGLYKSSYVNYVYSSQKPLFFPVVMDLHGNTLTATDSIDKLTKDTFCYEVVNTGDRFETTVYATVPYYYAVMGTKAYTTPAEAMANYSVKTEAVSGATAKDYIPSVTGVYYCKLTYSDGTNTLSLNSEPAHAHFKQYSIRFEANGGSGYMPSANLGNRYTLPECTFTAPANATFKCWEVNGTQMNPGDTITITNNVTIKAVWDIIPTTYDIAFDANGGTGTMANQTVADGAATVLSENVFTKEDHKFDGWNTSADGTGTSYADKASITSNLTELGKTITLYAQWKYVESYTVSFDANGGTGTMADAKKVSGNYTLPACTFVAPEGKRFKAWSIDGNEKNAGETISVSANTTVTAVWEDAPVVTAYTVTFDANGGTGTMEDVTNVSGDYTLPACAFTAPERKQFKTWSIDGNEKNVGETITVSANTTVVAVWEDITVTTYTITFDATGGTVTPENATTTADGKLSTLPTPVRSGRYTFRGWYTATSDGTQITTDTVFDTDTTVYAQWTYTGGSAGIGSYTVKFNTNGGSKIANKIVTGNTKVAKPADPTKEGCIFDGWYTDKALTNAYNFNKSVTKGFTLYAKWIETNPVHICPSEKFNDLDTSKWYHEATDFVIENKIMLGTSDTVFAPEGSLTRGMLVTILYRCEGEPATNRSIPFADVDMGAYYANAVSWAQQNGIVKGISETEYAPDMAITREQLATIMFRYAQFKGMNAVTMEENLNFKDASDISEWAVAAMNWAVGKDYIFSRTQEEIAPKTAATRTEIAAFIHRYIVNSAN